MEMVGKKIIPAQSGVGAWDLAQHQWQVCAEGQGQIFKHGIIF